MLTVLQWTITPTLGMSHIFSQNSIISGNLHSIRLILHSHARLIGFQDPYHLKSWFLYLFHDPSFTYLLHYSHMFMINHNLDVKVFPFRQAKREPDPGFWDSITSAIGGAIDHTKDTINNGINQGKDALGDVLVPDLIHLPTTNGVSSILADSNGCSQFSGGKATSFVMLDFVDVGQGMKAVDALNGFR